jgi:myo-inositol-1(or 4)-monophosphatase
VPQRIFIRCGFGVCPGIKRKRRSEMVEKMIRLATSCGEKMLEAKNIEKGIGEKAGTANFVTDYDKAIERYLKKELSEFLPQARFLGEEEDTEEKIDQGYAFIVDPIDGTTNFIKHFSHSAVSIALANQGEPVVGVVYNPYLKEVFWAEKGRGAWLNGERIHVSSRRLQDGIFLFGSTPYDKSLMEKTFSAVQTIFSHSLDCRRSGSAALDMCYAACGRCELYFEAMISPWDYAAGYLILLEAGGICSTMEDKEEKIPYGQKTSIVAGCPAAFKDYWRLMGF